MVLGEHLGAGEDLAWALRADVYVGKLANVHVHVVYVFLTGLDMMDKRPSGGETGAIAMMMLETTRDGKS